MLKVASELDSALDSALQQQTQLSLSLSAVSAGVGDGLSAAWQVPVTGAAGGSGADYAGSRANTRMSQLLAVRSTFCLP